MMYWLNIRYYRFAFLSQTVVNRGSWVWDSWFNIG